MEPLRRLRLLRLLLLRRKIAVLLEGVERSNWRNFCDDPVLGGYRRLVDGTDNTAPGALVLVDSGCGVREELVNCVVFGVEWMIRSVPTPNGLLLGLAIFVLAEILLFGPPPLTTSSKITAKLLLLLSVSPCLFCCRFDLELFLRFPKMRHLLPI